MKPVYLLSLYILLLSPFSFSQTNEVRLFVFGHSLIDHRPPAIPTPSDETTVLHWMQDIAAEAGYGFAAGGQYGFLPQHDNLPPISQWGYDQVPGVWDMDVEPFSAAEINTVMLTVANFIQYQPAHLPHPIDNSTTVLQSTETIFDWVDQEEDSVRFYIYANWPEMDLQNAFPPNLPQASEILEFHNQTTGSFLDWWVDYQDRILLSRPQFQVRLIPVGPIISKILRDRLPGQIPFDELYEDSDPHGRASLYFLAGMISYMAIYEEEVPASYMPSTIVHPVIRDSLASIRAFMWRELNSFNQANGDSRVFYSSTTTHLKPEPAFAASLQIFPNPSSHSLTIKGLPPGIEISFLSANGQQIKFVRNGTNEETSLNMQEVPAGIYLIRFYDPASEKYVSRRWVKP
ncbi:MAG: T9SS type A sorting domain-containing protein [Bacteroidota bacterium]